MTHDNVEDMKRFGLIWIYIFYISTIRRTALTRYGFVMLSKTIKIYKSTSISITVIRYLTLSVCREHVSLFRFSGHENIVTVLLCDISLWNNSVLVSLVRNEFYVRVA